MLLHPLPFCPPTAAPPPLVHRPVCCVSRQTLFAASFSSLSRTCATSACHLLQQPPGLSWRLNEPALCPPQPEPLSFVSWADPSLLPETAALAVFGGAHLRLLFPSGCLPCSSPSWQSKGHRRRVFPWTCLSLHFAADPLAAGCPHSYGTGRESRWSEVRATCFCGGPSGRPHPRWTRCGCFFLFLAPCPTETVRDDRPAKFPVIGFSPAQSSLENSWTSWPLGVPGQETEE